MTNSGIDLISAYCVRRSFVDVKMIFFLFATAGARGDVCSRSFDRGKTYFTTCWNENNNEEKNGSEIK